ncbi:pimeloyl-ACP methyl ester carboxylesterase [Streptomyces puniciscabiei]|uniref:Pimeloyl-ACP methyl ester carboxylesterase n=1 Tax=Streptomyces puniciscabiei TaxID=164348 RepID=A0A542UCI5_9ACTN|nr:alpha/beta hydrolase [Streptomyces puniciscabiei]TQK96799.1 pimeloyl-ACP methyl ester carboxylesterase [Streptomyces puniciscabiei]
MSTYVLVPGFFFGPWVWEDVGRLLEDAGHQVRVVSLTGQGERAGEATPEVSVTTHVADIVDAIGDLSDVVLVLHSGATTAGTAAADRVPERLRRIVYVDTAPFPDGMAQIEFLPPEVQEEQRRQIETEGQGWLLPARPFDEDDQLRDPVALAELSARDLALMREHASAQPAAMVLRPARRPAEIPDTPRTLVACTFSVEQVQAMVAAGVPAFSMLAGQDWTMIGLPTGHWPMLSRPKELAELLAGL